MDPGKFYPTLLEGEKTEKHIREGIAMLKIGGTLLFITGLVIALTGCIHLQSNVGIAAMVFGGTVVVLAGKNSMAA